jgi:hypothetical protein
VELVIEDGVAQTLGDRPDQTFFFPQERSGILPRPFLEIADPDPADGLILDGDIGTQLPFGDPEIVTLNGKTRMLNPGGTDIGVLPPRGNGFDDSGKRLLQGKIRSAQGLFDLIEAVEFLGSFLERSEQSLDRAV